MPPAQKQPVTRSILGRIYSNLKSVDAFFWVICLASLFGMLLKSHLIVKSARSFDAFQKLSRSGLTHGVVYAIKIVGLETHYLCCCLHILKVHFIVAFQVLL